MICCCDDLKYAVKTGDITYDAEGNKFYAYGQPHANGTTRCIPMVHCLFCGKPLVIPKPKPKTDNGVFTIEHECSKCKHIYNVNVCSVATTCPECGHWDVENIGASKTEPA